MEKKTEIHYAIVMGTKGRWIFPVETDSETAKEMRDDGIQINLAENEFIRTDTMKVYSIDAQGDNKKWILLSPLEPEIAQEMKSKGLLIDEVIGEKTDDMEYYWKESEQPLEPEKKVVNKKAGLVKKSEPKGEMPE